MIDNLFDVLRCLNVGLASATAMALGIRVNDDWVALTRGWRITITGLLMFPMTAAYGSIESLLAEVPIGLRTVLVTVSCLVTLIGLWVARGQDQVPLRTVAARDVLAVIDGADASEHGDPCTHPGCIRARIELRRLTTFGVVDHEHHDPT